MKVVKGKKSIIVKREKKRLQKSKKNDIIVQGDKK